MAHQHSLDCLVRGPGGTLECREVAPSPEPAQRARTKAPKVKIVVEKRENHVTKGSIGLGTKATSWQYATFAFARKHFKPDELRIRVTPWSPKTHHIDPALERTFPAGGITEARRYAKDLLEEGKSHFLNIDMQVWGYLYTREGWHTLEEEHMEREDWESFSREE